jgi:hypothetical protein
MEPSDCVSFHVRAQRNGFGRHGSTTILSSHGEKARRLRIWRVENLTLPEAEFAAK